ncbi:polyhydroxyalkanoate synthesis repressor PhaR [Paracoccaceae bacterium GXU_MW_L88]
MAARKRVEGEPIVIKKYANRRLYNTEKSSYVTLDSLSELVREGREFVVRDAKSGEDITRTVLAQIIFDEESKGQTMLPTNFLRQLIQLYGDALQGFVPGYLESSMQSFAENQDKFRQQLRATLGSNPAMIGMEELVKRNMEIYQNAMRMFSPFQQGEKGGEMTADKAEIAALKTQMAEMQKQIERLSGEKADS